MRSWLEKLFLVLPLVALACLLGALYCVLHNQLSYSLSPEYFTLNRFRLLEIAAEDYNRVGASIVGLQAGWWMGLLIGFPIALLGILQPTWRRMLRQTWQAYLLVIGFTTLFGALGLAASWVMVPASGLVTVDYPRGVLDPQAFSRAGFMHDASYLGGFMGIILGTLYQIYQALRDYHLPANQTYTAIELPLPLAGTSAADATGGGKGGTTSAPAGPTRQAAPPDPAPTADSTDVTKKNPPRT